MAQQFSSCRERLQPDCWSECVAVVEVARLDSENVASEKKRNSLKLSGDRLPAVTRTAAAAVVLREELVLLQEGLALLREELALKS